MTTEEKLEHFETFCIEDARSRSIRMLDEYTKALEKSFAEHQADAHQSAERFIREETGKIQREVNKHISIEQIRLKRALGRKQNELREKLFEELLVRLTDYMKTPDYPRLLESQIQKAMEIAGSDLLVIYLDPVDADKVPRYVNQFGADIRVSKIPFIGGTRAVISSKNILIDNSFQSRLAEEKDNFRFNLNTRMGGAFHG